MTRCFARSLLVSFALASVLSAPAMAQTPPGQTPAQLPAAQSQALQQKAAAPTCTYSSKTFGDGAFVCVENSLMLKCTVEDAKASWNVVADKDLGDKCRAPAPAGTIYQQRARWNRQNIAREITPP